LDKKYGYGGKKRFAKSNDRKSLDAPMRGKGKGKGGGLTAAIRPYWGGGDS